METWQDIIEASDAAMRGVEGVLGTPKQCYCEGPVQKNIENHFCLILKLHFQSRHARTESEDYEAAPNKH